MVGEDISESVGKVLGEGNGDAKGEDVELSHDDAVALAFALGENRGVGVREGSGEAESVVAMEAVEESQGEGVVLEEDE